MMKRIFVLLLVCFWGLAVVAQNKVLILSGHVDSSFLVKSHTSELMVRIHNPALALNNMEREYVVPVKEDRSFSLRVTLDGDIGQLSYWFRYLGTGPYYNMFKQVQGAGSLTRWFVVEAGDSLVMYVNKEGNLSFRGKGAQKMNAQSSVFNLDARLSALTSRSGALQREGDYPSAIKLETEGLAVEQRLREALIETFRKDLSAPVFGMIRWNALARLHDAYLEQVVRMQSGMDPVYRAASAALVTAAYEDYMKDFSLDQLKEGARYCPAVLMEYMVEREWIADKIGTDDPRRGLGFRTVLERIRSGYKGDLRERMLMAAVKRLNRPFNPEVTASLPEIAELLISPQAKKALEIFGNRQGAAFPFVFQDKDGKAHTLKDYKGKVIVMDFWFTGCGACIFLNTAMHSVVGRYRGNPDVVFLSVCIDSEKSVWLKSVASGQYSVPGMVSLYSNGLGRSHPLIRHYNFSGAPNLLIIDGKGKLVSSALVLPSAGLENRFQYKDGRFLPDDELTLNNPSAKSFMALIDQALSR